MCGQCPVDDFIGQTFPTPKGGVLTVVGDNGLKGSKKKYKLTCSICHEDKELFPEMFESVKSSLNAGSVPCGCSFNPKWKQFQIIILVKRHLDKVGKYEGNKFVGFDGGEYKSVHSTKVILNCPEHGEYKVAYNNLTSLGTCCASCATTGYQPAKPGHLYVTNWINYDKDTNEFFKIGISNEYTRRIKDQSRKTSYKPHQLIVFKFEDGSIPQEL